MFFKKNTEYDIYSKQNRGIQTVSSRKYFRLNSGEEMKSAIFDMEI